MKLLSKTKKGIILASLTVFMFTSCDPEDAAEDLIDINDEIIDEADSDSSNITDFTVKEKK